MSYCDRENLASSPFLETRDVSRTGSSIWSSTLLNTYATRVGEIRLASSSAASKRSSGSSSNHASKDCVIKGQTPHFDLICNSTFSAILKITIDFNKPVGNGIITALNMNQAVNRSKKSSLKNPNKGSEAANAVISILSQK